MLPEPPPPPSPPSRPVPSTPRERHAAAPVSALRRRGSDQSAQAGAGPAVAGMPAKAVAAQAKVALPVRSADGAAWRWPLPAVAALLAGSGAVLAAACAWLLATALGWSAVSAAAAGAALAVLAAAVPTLAVALDRLRDAAQAESATPAPLRDRDTGAWRRDMFIELAEREWARARRYGTGAGLLIVDLDRSARLKEAHGAAAADAFLTALTRHTSPTLRGADIITRLAPTQLGVFLAQADSTGALDVAERIRERAEALDLAWPGPDGAAISLRATVSVGVAPLRPAHINLQALTHDAEDAVCAARLAGGNCVRSAPVDAGPSPMPGSWRDDHLPRPQ